MTTPKHKKRRTAPFTQAEIEEVTETQGDPSLEEVEAAEIELSEGNPATVKPFQSTQRLGVRHVVESILFVASQPLTLGQLQDATGTSEDQLKQVLEELAQDHREGVSGIVLSEISAGWQFRTAQFAAEWVRAFLKVKPQRLTRAALETLAIVAYRQPVTRPEVEDVRGVDSGAVMKALLERRLVKMLGKKEDVGRPILYGTTREFLEFFGLKDLGALPTLREFHELSEENKAVVEKTVAEPFGRLDDLIDAGYRERLEGSVEASERALAQLEEGMAEADRSVAFAAKALVSTTDEPLS